MLTYRSAFGVAATGSLLLHSAVLLANVFLQTPKVGQASNSSEQQVLHFEVRPLQENVTDTTAQESRFTQKMGTTTDVLASQKDLSLEGSPPSSELSGPTSSERFFTVHEVDQPASPFADWIVPWDDLRNAQVKEFVVRLWILSTGEVLQADVLQTLPTSVDDFVKKSLSLSLLRTQTNPAIKDGKPVASQRTIEVTLEL